MMTARRFFKHSFAFLILWVSAIVLTACAKTYLYDDAEIESGRFKTAIGQYQLIIQGVAENSLEVQYIGSEQSTFPSFARETDKVWPVEVRKTSDKIEIVRGDLRAVINNWGQIHFYRGKQLLTSQLAYRPEHAVQFHFQLDDQEKIMGGGERVLGMNRRGHSLPLYNRADYGYETESEQMNYSLPAVMSSDKYYLLFDNTARGTLDIGKSHPDQLSFSAVGGRAAYIIGVEESYPELIDEYTDVTGKPAMLPRWALGHFISRFGYHTEQEVREVVALTREHEIPADAVILDLYWFGPDIKGHMGNLDWDLNNFPTPENMIDDLAEAGTKTILITEPFILTTSTRWQEAVESNAISRNDTGEPYRFDFYFGNTGLVDIFSDQGRDWFGDRYKELFAQGVAGNWGDLGEPEVHPDDILHQLSDYGISARGDEVHNAYGHEWARLVYETQKRIQPDRRPFILMRSGFAGSQRYGIIPWTGDVNRSWGGLKPQVELGLAMSLFGLGYTHSDIGGFAGTEFFEPELYLRWAQYGIFQPIFRPHAQEQVASEVVFQDPEIRDIVRDYVKLRYRLTPYNYSLMYAHNQTGMPLMRPMFFEDESNSSLIDVVDQYLWGDAFLVKPVTDPGLSRTTVRLPAGVWFDYWSDDLYLGNQTIEYGFSKQTLPVMVRGGSFIPMVPEYNHVGEYSSSQLAVHYYHHKSVSSARGQMYEDDGELANAFQKGAYEHLNFSSELDRDMLTIAMNRQAGRYPGMPVSRTMSLIVHGWTAKPSQVLINQEPISSDQLTYDPQRRQLMINWHWKHQDVTIQVTTAIQGMN